MISALVADPVDTNKLLVAPAGRVSQDTQYLRHEFSTYLGGWHWTNGWTPPEVREAVTQHLRGWFWQSAGLARDVVRFAPIMGAFKQRLGPPLRTKWRVAGGTRAPARYAAEDLLFVWRELRRFYGDILRDLAMMGFAWVHTHWVPDMERGVEMPRCKRWPFEATQWRPPSPAFPGGYYASTMGDGLVRMVHGDGHWTMIGNGERPHELGAILALGLQYVGGSLEERDRAGLSEAAGRAAPIAELPDKVAVKDEIGQSVQDMIAGLGRTRKGGVVPFGTKVNGYQATSDTSFFKEGLADRLVMVALALLGQSGTLVSGSGGVYQAPVFEGVLEGVVDGDHECTERGWLEGISTPFVEVNGYAAQGVEPPPIFGERPVDKHAKAKSFGERENLFQAAIKAERENGFNVDQARVDDLAEHFDVPAPKLASTVKGGEIFAYHIQTNTVARDEVRARLGLDPLPDGAGSVERLAEQLNAGPAEAQGGASDAAAE